MNSNEINAMVASQLMELYQSSMETVFVMTKSRFPSTQEKELMKNKFKDKSIEFNLEQLVQMEYDHKESMKKKKGAINDFLKRISYHSEDSTMSDFFETAKKICTEGLEQIEQMECLKKLEKIKNSAEIFNDTDHLHNKNSAREKPGNSYIQGFHKKNEEPTNAYQNLLKFIEKEETLKNLKNREKSEERWRKIDKWNQETKKRVEESQDRIEKLSKEQDKFFRKIGMSNNQTKSNDFNKYHDFNKHNDLAGDSDDNDGFIN